MKARIGRLTVLVFLPIWLATGCSSFFGDVFDGSGNKQVLNLVEKAEPINLDTAKLIDDMRDAPPVQAHLTLRRVQIAAHRLQKRGFSTARGPEKDETIRLNDVKADTISGGDERLRGLILQRDAVDVQQFRLHRA